MKNVVITKSFDTPIKKGTHHRLLCMTGENKGTFYYLKGKRILMGRSNDSDIQILDIKASKKHVELVLKRNRYILSDLKSQNGVYINNVKEMQSNLNEGDKISIGTTVFKYTRIEVREDLNELQTDIAKDNQGVDSKEKKKSKVPMILIMGFLLYMFLEPEQKRSERKPAAEISNTFLQNIRKSSKKLTEEDKEIKKKIDNIIHRGLRELREGNHFRAIEEFNNILVISPHHDRAEFYRNKTKQALDEEVKENFLRAKRDVDALKYRAAAVSYCDILKLLQGYDNDQRYKDAKANLEIIEEKIGLETGEIKCF